MSLVSNWIKHIVYIISICCSVSSWATGQNAGNTAWTYTTETLEKIEDYKDKAFYSLNKFDKKPFSSQQHSIWIKKTLINNDQYPVTYGLTAGTHSRVDWYLCDRTCKKIAVHGELIKTRHKNLEDHEDFAEFSLPAQFNGDIVAHIRSYKHHGYRAINPKLFSTLEFSKTLEKKTLLESKLIQVYTFIFGALICFLIYPINLYIHHRRKYYVYYALYIIGIVLTLMIRVEIELDHNFLASHIPVFSWKLGDSSSLFAMAFYVAFFRSFIETKKHYPILDKILKSVFYLTTAWCIAALISNFVFNAQYLTYQTGFVVRLALIIAAICCIVTLSRSKDKIHHYIAIGTTIMAVGGFITNILRLFPGLLQEPYQSIWDWKLMYWNGSIIFELFFFSLALSYQYFKDGTEKREALKNYVDQLTENRILQEKYNTQLEVEVAKRTAENIKISQELQHKQQNQ